MSSLDDRYLQFRERTSSVFADHPELETLRHFVFKELLERRSILSPLHRLRSRVRYLLPVGRRGELRQADVLVWLESHRREHAESLLGVEAALRSSGLTTQIVAFSGPEGLPNSVVHIGRTAHVAKPDWALSAWRGLVAAEPDLPAAGIKETFLLATVRAAAALDEARRVLDTVQPVATLSATSVLTGGAALATEARRTGIATFLLQHGIPQVFYTPFPDDVMLTWGTDSNRILTTLGISEDRLIVTGSPRHDSMVGVDATAARTELLNQLSLPEQTTIAFFSNGNDLLRNGVAPEESAAWLGRAAEIFRNVNFIVRLHPNEDGRLYSSFPGLTITKHTPDFVTTVAGADCVASVCSTVMYEALLMDKPVWQFHAPGWPELADNWRHGLATRVASEGELHELVFQANAGGRAGRVDSSIVDRVFANRGAATTTAARTVAARVRDR